MYWIMLREIMLREMFDFGFRQKVVKSHVDVTGQYLPPVKTIPGVKWASLYKPWVCSTVLQFTPRVSFRLGYYIPPKAILNPHTQPLYNDTVYCNRPRYTPSPNHRRVVTVRASDLYVCLVGYELKPVILIDTWLDYRCVSYNEPKACISEFQKGAQDP